MAAPRSGHYRWYMLGVLTLVYVFNFLDRQLLSILANDIKRDLGLSDAGLGFLYGTAFGVFYALFGIPLGRLADNWPRTRLLAIGVGLWSLATAASGFARSLPSLALARIGVGVGEATASPCSYALIADSFPKEKRGLALGIYSTGVYIGIGLSLFIGGLIVERWNAAFAGGAAPLGLRGWQAAFVIIGAPGLLLALWVASLRGPGRVATAAPQPFRLFLSELAQVVPPLTLVSAARRSRRALFANIAFAGMMAAAAALLVKLFGPASLTQWATLATGTYALFSWACAQRASQPAAFAATLGSRPFVALTLGYSLISLVGYAFGFWAAPFAERAYGVDKATLGLLTGATAGIGGFLGVLIGGRIADALASRTPGGRILAMAGGALGPCLLMIPTFSADNLMQFSLLYFCMNMLSSSALSPAAAATQDMVPPALRGTATAIFFVGINFIGLSLGPYLAGQISTRTGSLQLAMFSLMGVAPFILLCLGAAWRSLRAEAAIQDRQG